MTVLYLFKQKSVCRKQMSRYGGKVDKTDGAASYIV